MFVFDVEWNWIHGVYDSLCFVFKCLVLCISQETRNMKLRYKVAGLE